MRPSPPMVPDDDVKMIMSGQPPSMHIIVEGMEVDIREGNLQTSAPY